MKINTKKNGICKKCGALTVRGFHHGGQYGPIKKFCSDICKNSFLIELLHNGREKHKERTSKLSSERMRLNNPMRNPQWRKKAVETRKKMGYSFKTRGGNGQEMPIPQRILLSALGDGWYAEHSVATKLRGKTVEKYPTCYKIDIANPRKMIAIEIDGTSHDSLKAQERDKKKTILLEQLGWKVFRFKNEEVMKNIEEVLKFITSL